MKLVVLPEHFAICRLAASSSIPSWFTFHESLVSITYTRDECSIVCPEHMLSGDKSQMLDVQVERGWRAIKVIGPLDFSLTGILASLATPLADEHIPLFALSTFETDYLLVKDRHIVQAQTILVRPGHVFIE